MEEPKTAIGRMFTYFFIPSFLFVPWKFEYLKITSKKVIDGKYVLKVYTGGNNRTSVEVPEDVYEKHHVHSRIRVKLRSSRHNTERIRAKLA